MALRTCRICCRVMGGRSFQNLTLSQAWSHACDSSTLEAKAGDHHEFMVSLVTQQDLVSKNQNQTTRKKATKTKQRKIHQPPQNKTNLRRNPFASEQYLKFKMKREKRTKGYIVIHIIFYPRIFPGLFKNPRFLIIKALSGR